MFYSTLFQDGLAKIYESCAIIYQSVMIIYIISGRTTFDRYRRQTTPLPFTKNCPQGYDGKGTAY